MTENATEETTSLKARMVTATQSARETLAHSRRMPPFALKMLVRTYSQRERWDLARSPSTTTEMLVVLAEHSEDSARASVASNPSTPLDVLQVLSYDTAHRVRKAIAGNHNTPAAILEALAEDTEALVREAVASNPSTPPATLQVLAQGLPAFVSSAAIHNPGPLLVTPKKLGRDAASWVRVNVRGTPNITTEPCGLLESEAEKYPQEVVEDDYDEDAAYDGYEEQWHREEEIALDPASTPEQLSRLATNAVNSASPEALAALARYRADRSESEVINPAVAIPEATTPTRKLFGFSVPWGQRTAPTTAVVAPPVEEALLPSIATAGREVAADVRTSPGLLAVLAASADPVMRTVVARNPTTPADVLVALAEDADGRVRFSVAGNSATPPATLAALASDEDGWVQVALRENPSTPATDPVSTPNQGQGMRLGL